MEGTRMMNDNERIDVNDSEADERMKWNGVDTKNDTGWGYVKRKSGRFGGFDARSRASRSRRVLYIGHNTTRPTINRRESHIRFMHE
jgi:hypothetical protein